MRGHIKRQTNLFVKINLEELVPAGHPLRPIKAMADEALGSMSRTFAAAYAPSSKGGALMADPAMIADIGRVVREWAALADWAKKHGAPQRKPHHAADA